MSVSETIIRAAGGVTPAALQAALTEHRAAFTAEQLALQRTGFAHNERVVSAIGQAFAAGLDRMGGGGRGLGKYRQPAFSGHALCYRALSLRAQEVAAVPFRVAKLTSDGERVPLEHDPVLDLLADPFPELYDTGTQWLEMLTLFLLVGGNAWVMPDDARHSKTKLPLSLQVFGRNTVSPAINRTSWRLQHWIFRFGSRPRPLAPDELWHIKCSNPDDATQIMGLGPVQAAQGLLDTDFAREAFEGNLLTNGAAPALKMAYAPTDEQMKAGLPKEMTQDQMEQVKGKFIDGYEGVDKAGKTVFTNAGWSLEALGMSKQDLQFVEQEKIALRKLGFVLGVPSVLMNDHEGGGLSTTQIEAAEALLARQSTVPLCKRIGAFLDRVLIKPYNPQLEGYFDTDEIAALQVNFDKKVERFETLVKNQVSPRAAANLVDLGIDPAQLSDEALVPFNLIPLSQLVGTGRAPDIDVDPADPVTAEGDDDARATRRVVLPRLPPRIMRWRGIVDTYAPLEDRYRNVVRRYVLALGAETDRNLRRWWPTRAIDAELLRQILFDPTAAADEIRTLSEPFFADALQIGTSGVAGEIGVTELGLSSPAVQAALRLRVTEVVGINDTIADHLRTALGEAFDAGDTLTDTALRIRDVFNASASRARTIARTEIAGGVNTGRFVEMAGQGITRHSWLSAGDNHVRTTPFNHLIDGESVAIGTAFSNGLRHPSDANGAAANILNCRCAATPDAPRG